MSPDVLPVVIPSFVVLTLLYVLYGDRRWFRSWGGGLYVLLSVALLLGEDILVPASVRRLDWDLFRRNDVGLRTFYTFALLLFIRLNHLELGSRGRLIAALAAAGILLLHLLLAVFWLQAKLVPPLVSLVLFFLFWHLSGKFRVRAALNG